MSNWLTNAIALEAKYDEGFDAGKQAAAEQIFEELDETLTAKLETFNTLKEDPELASPLEHESEYWLGRAVTCGETLHLIYELKKKYGVIK